MPSDHLLFLWVPASLRSIGRASQVRVKRELREATAGPTAAEIVDRSNYLPELRDVTQELPCHSLPPPTASAASTAFTPAEWVCSMLDCCRAHSPWRRSACSTRSHIRRGLPPR